MKRRLVVTIDAGEKACGECEHMECDILQFRCRVFRFWLGSRYGDERVTDPLRCQPCLDAEVRNDEEPGQ